MARTTLPNESPQPWTSTLSPTLPTSLENSTTPTFTQSPQELPELSGQYVPDEVVVRFRKNATAEKIQQCLSSAGASILSSIEELKVLVVNVPSGMVAEAISVLSTCPEVRYAEPNYLAFIADTIPSDPNWILQYGLISIRAPQGWDYSTGSSAVTIAIIDSGVDLNHPDLVGKIVAGYDFVNNDAIAQDDNGHGTHVAGIAAASANNGYGVVGVSWGARIMPVKVLNAGGGGSFADVADGIIWAADHGAQVINLSLGGASSSTVLQDAVNYAYGKGVILIAAAGNTGSGTVLYPARYPNVIAVGAVDNTNNHTGFSNFGPELDLVAPGASIYSSVIGGYGYKSGTSMAAPFVAGLAAILRGYPAGSSPDAIAFEMESTALDLGVSGVDNLYGYGLIQMDSAIRLVYEAPTPTFTPTFPPTNTAIFVPTSMPDISGKRILPPTNGYVSTVPALTMASPVQSSTATPTLLISTLTGTLTSILDGQNDETPEVYALSTPQTTGISTFSYYAVPCVGVVMILSGILLFIMARRRQDYSKRRRIL